MRVMMRMAYISRQAWKTNWHSWNDTFSSIPNIFLLICVKMHLRAKIEYLPKLYFVVDGAKQYTMMIFKYIYTATVN